MVVGCTNSDQAKIDAGMKRAANNKPGFIRLVNFGETPATMFQGDRPLFAGTTEKGIPSRMVPLGVGAKKLIIQIGKDTKIPVEVMMESDKATYVMLMADEKTVTNMFAGSYRPNDSGNVAILFLDENGSPVPEGPKVSIKGGTGTSNAGAGTVSVGSGSCTVSGANLTESADTDIEDKAAYTFVMLKSGDKFKPFLMRNTASEKAVSAGQSQ